MDFYLWIRKATGHHDVTGSLKLSGCVINRFSLGNKYAHLYGLFHGLPAAFDIQLFVDVRRYVL